MGNYIFNLIRNLLDERRQRAFDLNRAKQNETDKLDWIERNGDVFPEMPRATRAERLLITNRINAVREINYKKREECERVRQYVKNKVIDDKHFEKEYYLHL